MDDGGGTDAEPIDGWQHVAGMGDACQVQYAVDPRNALPARDWIPCTNGASGCSEMKTGPVVYAMRKLEIVEHDGKAGLTFDERSFVVMVDRAFVQVRDQYCDRPSSTSHS